MFPKTKTERGCKWEFQHFITHDKSQQDATRKTEVGRNWRVNDRERERKGGIWSGKVTKDQGLR